MTGERVTGSMKPNIREENQVWAEVELPADIDYQTIADSRAVMTRKGHRTLRQRILRIRFLMVGITDTRLTPTWKLTG